MTSRRVGAVPVELTLDARLVAETFISAPTSRRACRQHSGSSYYAPRHAVGVELTTHANPLTQDLNPKPFTLSPKP
jgi:hypothetical protein